MSEKEKVTLKWTPTTDVLNANGHVFPKEVVEKAMNEYMEKDNKFVTMGYSQGETIDLSKVVGEVESYEPPNNVTIQLLDTPEAKRLREIMDNDKNALTSTLGIGAKYIGTVADGSGIVDIQEMESVSIIRNEDRA